MSKKTFKKPINDYYFPEAEVIIEDCSLEFYKCK